MCCKAICNYYRKFIEHFVQIAKPLYKQILGDNAKLKSHVLEWTQEHEDCFQNLKNACCTTPVLAYADYLKPFILHTDALKLGLRAVLYQVQDDGKKHPIAFASRNLTKLEGRYHSSRLEFLALKWSVVEHFHEYLYGSQFDVYMDNNPLTYVLSSAKLDATGQWWVASPMSYDFKIYYKSGKTNADADA